MGTIAHDLVEALRAQDADGTAIYDDRDRTIAIAILAAAEGTPFESLGRAQAHVRRLYRWAGVDLGDATSKARTKITSYLEREPIHPALMTQLARVLRRAVAHLADPNLRQRIQTDWVHSAQTEHERSGSRGSLVNFMIRQRKADA